MRKSKRRERMRAKRLRCELEEAWRVTHILGVLDGLLLAAAAVLAGAQQPLAESEGEPKEQ